MMWEVVADTKNSYRVHVLRNQLSRALGIWVILKDGPQNGSMDIIVGIMMQILGPHLRPPELEILGMRPTNLCFGKTSRLILYMPKFENCPVLCIEGIMKITAIPQFTLQIVSERF